MQEITELLNEKKLIQFGWDEIYHQNIHLPENILNGYHNTESNDIPDITGTKVTIITISPVDFLLYQLLKETYHQKLHICHLNDLPTEWSHEQGCLIVPDFMGQLNGIPDSDNVVLIDRKPEVKDQKITHISVKHISEYEQLGTYWGTICQFLDKTFGFDNSLIIKKVVAFCVEKAGALASGQNYNANLAKLWAADIAEAASCQVITPIKLYETMAVYWQEMLMERAELKAGSELTISLEEFLNGSISRDNACRIFYADGDTLIFQLISLYYFVNITAIYTVILKDKKI